MAERVYCKTKLGEAELRRSNGKVAGDEKRLMLLVDGSNSIKEIAAKVPPSVRVHLDDIVERLLNARFIEEVEVADAKSVPVTTGGHSSRDEAQATMVESQKFHKDMLALAEMEILRRIELEQELSVSQSKLALAQRKLSEVEAQLVVVSDKYGNLKQQVQVYKQGMQAKVLELKSRIDRKVGAEQENKAHSIKAEHELRALRVELHRMQKAVKEKEAALDATLKLRMLEEKRAEEMRMQQEKQAAEEMVRDHPHYLQVRRLGFFKEFQNAELAQLLVWARWREIKSGEHVVVEGERDITFYVLVSGKLGVVKGHKTIGVLQAGEPFGEIAFLTGAEPVRSASIVARTDSVVMALDPAYLDGAELVIRMRIAEAFMRVQAKRLRGTIEMVVNLLADNEEV